MANRGSLTQRLPVGWRGLPWAAGRRELPAPDSATLLPRLREGERAGAGAWSRALRAGRALRSGWAADGRLDRDAASPVLDLLTDPVGSRVAQPAQTRTAVASRASSLRRAAADRRCPGGRPGRPGPRAGRRRRTATRGRHPARGLRAGRRGRSRPTRTDGCTSASAGRPSRSAGEPKARGGVGDLVPGQQSVPAAIGQRDDGAQRLVTVMVLDPGHGRLLSRHTEGTYSQYVRVARRLCKPGAYFRYVGPVTARSERQRPPMLGRYDTTGEGHQGGHPRPCATAGLLLVHPPHPGRACDRAVHRAGVRRDVPRRGRRRRRRDQRRALPPLLGQTGAVRGGLRGHRGSRRPAHHRARPAGARTRGSGPPSASAPSWRCASSPGSVGS